MAPDGKTVVGNFAPGWVVFKGIRVMLFSSLFASPVIAMLRFTYLYPDFPEVKFDFVTVLLSLIGLCGLLGLIRGVSILFSATAKGYFLAGPKGISLRFPEDMIIVFPVRSYDILWENVRGITPYSSSVNGIPISKELRIYQHSGRRIDVSSYFFHESLRSIHQKLLRLEEERRLQPAR